jgi:hypothetical protein
MSQRASDIYLQNNVNPPTEKQRLDELERIRFAEMQKITKQLEEAKANQSQQNSLKIGENLTVEDKFYEMIGIKKTDGSGWGLQSRPVGRLLVLVALVGGYFAYKKYKKM